ncbi:MAG: hypothetical protein R3C45_18465 [Phycisphaerales bacterium]
MTQNHDLLAAPYTQTLIRIKARQLCRRTDFSYSDYDDMRQGMRLHLLEKAHLFDPERGNLEAFVTQLINTWVAMQLRHHDCLKRREDKKAVSFERTMVEHEGETTHLGHVLLEDDGQRRAQAYPKSDIERFELLEAIEHVMSTLNTDDRDLLLSIAKHGLKATARLRGVSWRQVTNARDRLRVRESWPRTRLIGTALRWFA